MREGGVRRLVIPPSLAYGAPRSGVLPPYATLLFDIELVSVTPVQASR
jgi:FKBP-type peptidyl-prolyl cis-trans isomerase